jgi:hypothetical protein
VQAILGAKSSSVRRLVQIPVGAAKMSRAVFTRTMESVHVENGQFTYTVPHPNVTTRLTTTFPATVAPDGSFHGEIITGSISGRVDSTQIEGKIDRSACFYALSGDRI